jgi:hypothetical protein
MMRSPKLLFELELQELQEGIYNKTAGTWVDACKEEKTKIIYVAASSPKWGEKLEHLERCHILWKCDRFQITKKEIHIQNFIQEKTTSKLSLGNICYHSVQILLAISSNFNELKTAVAPNSTIQ